MLFDKDATTNPPVINHLPFKDKAWTKIGNGNEILAKKQKESSVSAEDSESSIDSSKKTIAKFAEGDLVYHSARWTPVTSIKDSSTLVIKIEDKAVEVPTADCTKVIPIQALFCTSSELKLSIIHVNGKQILSDIAKKLLKMHGVKGNKCDWNFAGKKRDPKDTIEMTGIKPNDKIACMAFGYEMKTFKRFQRLDTSRGWYMAGDSPDAITFVPSKSILLFGFGMYNTREGPPTYTIEYEVLLGDDKVKTEKKDITKPDETTEITKMFLNTADDPIPVPADTKITVSVKYPTYDQQSRLLVGTGGGDYETIAENEAGLFKVEDSSLSQNGTDKSSGQIPEIYYALVN